LILGVSGIASEEAFGAATVLNTSIITVAPTSIPSEEAFGAPFVATVLAPTGITSQEAFGAAVVVSTYTTILCSGTAYGSGQLSIGQVLLAGTTTGSSTPSASAVIVHLMGGATIGQGQLVWNGPNPINGVGSLVGNLELICVPRPICCPTRPQQTFSYMQTLGAGGLVLCPSSIPSCISFAIYQVLPGGYQQLRGAESRTPGMTSDGCFYATGVAGECGQPGNWAIVWSWEKSPGCGVETYTEYFRVLDAAMRTPCDPKRKHKFGWDC
jgi:hypothetical protein